MINAEYIGSRIADKMFKFYSNPFNRRPTFSWSRFPTMVKDWLKPRAWQHFQEGTAKEELDLACETAFNRATQLIKENNLT